MAGLTDIFKGLQSGNGGNNNAVMNLLPMLMGMNGGGGGNNALINMLPMLMGMNNGGQFAPPPQPAAAAPPPYPYYPPYPPQGERYIDYTKLYPSSYRPKDYSNINLDSLPKIGTNNSFTPPPADADNQMASLMQMLQYMQGNKGPSAPFVNNAANNNPNPAKSRLHDIDAIAPTKIKQSLEAILSLNGVIRK